MSETLKNKVLTDIYTSNEVKEVIAKLKPEHLQEDIKQHCFLELFAKPDAEILDLHNRGKLKSYIVKTLYNTAHFSRTSFAKQLGKETPTDFCFPSSFEVMKFDTSDMERMQVEEAALCEAPQIYWYKYEILKLYAELGTYKKVSEATGIPVMSIHVTCKQARQDIKERLWK